MVKLYEIAKEMQGVLARLDAAETTEEIEAVCADLHKVEQERDSKLWNIAAAVKNYEAEADAIGQEIKRLKEKQDTAERRAKRLCEYAGFYMGEKPWKSSDGAHALRWYPSEAVEVFGDVPEQYQRIVPETREPDKKLIKQSLKEGAALTFAKLEQRKSLVVK